MKTIVLATGNAHKVEEFNRLVSVFNLEGIRFVSAKETSPHGMPNVVEDSGTFVGNARLKAQALKTCVPADCFVLADDSGLCVDALGGAPGVETAYYAGPKATSEKNRRKLLSALENIPAEKRGAHFVCLLLLISPDGTESVFEGKCEGAITCAEAGTGGFGYDPIFMPTGFDKTFAELDGTVKDQLSHRGKAFSVLAAFLRKQKSRN